MVDQETFEYLLPLAYAWAQAQEEVVLARGIPLGPQQIADARRVGVRDPSQVRVLVVDRIPLPENPELAEATKRAQIITDASRCTAFGRAIIVRGDSWGDRELLVHNLVHIAQCERSGGLAPWIREYLTDRANCREFTSGPLEAEARGLAREICSPETPAGQVAA